MKNKIRTALLAVAAGLVAKKGQAGKALVRRPVTSLKNRYMMRMLIRCMRV